MSEVILSTEGESAVLELGGRIARVGRGQRVIYLHGGLGAGKTTLSRDTLHGLDHAGSVKSPTFTLVGPHEIGKSRAYYFNLYQFTDVEELELFGIRNYLDGNALCLIE